MNKDEVERHAARLGINLDGKSWNQAHSLVAKALKAEEEHDQKAEIARLKRELRERDARIQSLEVEHEGRAPGRAPSAEEIHNRIMIAPEVPMNSKQQPQYAYKEELPNEVMYDEVEYDLKKFNAGIYGDDNVLSGSYKVRGKTNNKVVADVSGPRYQKGISIHPDREHCAVAMENGVPRGYIVFNHVYQDFLDCLRMPNDGFYEDKYIDKIRKREFYVGPHLCIPISFGNNILSQIEEAERKREKYEQL